MKSLIVILIFVYVAILGVIFHIYGWKVGITFSFLSSIMILGFTGTSHDEY